MSIYRRENSVDRVRLWKRHQPAANICGWSDIHDWKNDLTIELISLCTATVTPIVAADLGTTPAGHRVMVTIREAIWEGDRLKAHVKSGAATGDWMVISPDGVGLIDIRITLETDDGALIVRPGDPGLQAGGEMASTPCWCL
jgi:hypothetical protein